MGNILNLSQRQLILVLARGHPQLSESGYGEMMIAVWSSAVCVTRSYVSDEKAT